MRIICISDTHGLHKQVKLPEGDVLVHAGDIENAFAKNKSLHGVSNLIDFNKWLGEQPHTHKVVIAGNHDRFIQANRDITRTVLSNAHYLEHESVELDGVKFFGSPWQPEFYSWAFNLPRGKELAHKWSQIPEDTQVLITHSPPMGILDKVGHEHVGCTDMSERIRYLKALKLHVFGHIHIRYGELTHDGVHYVNAAQVYENYMIGNKPIVFDLEV